MEWLNKFLNNKIEIEAEQTDAQTEFDKKVKASTWLQESMKIDADQVDKEYNANLEAEAKALGKTAAYSSFDTVEDTLKKDYEKSVKILSDYALAEWLMNIRGEKAQNLPEMAVELKEKAKRDVASSREKCEKEVLEHVGMSAQLDWQKSFDKYTKEAKPEEPKEKDIFSGAKPETGKQNWEGKEAKDKDFVISDKEKTTQAGAGNGREAEERQDVTKQPGEPQDKKASLKVDAFLVRDPDELKIGNKITLARSVMSKEGTILSAGGDYEITATEGERFIITANGKSYTICRFDTPKMFVNANLNKKADYQGWKNSETWQVALWLDNDQGLNAVSAEMAQTIQDPNQLAESLKNLVEEAKPDLGASLWDDMINWALAEVDWVEIAEHFTSKFAESSLKTESHCGSCPVCGSEGRDLSNGVKDNMSCEACGISYAKAQPEIQSHASKAEVIAKVAELNKSAEVQSPWKIVTDPATGIESIARVDNIPTNMKESEEDLEKELQKK
jgi:hypothetical protein